MGKKKPAAHKQKGKGGKGAVRSRRSDEGVAAPVGKPDW